MTSWPSWPEGRSGVRGAERRSARQPTFRPHLPRCVQSILIRPSCGDVHLARAGHKSHLRRRLRRLLFFFFNLLFNRQKKNKRFKKTNRKTTLGSVRLWQEKQITILRILLHTDV